MIGVPNHSDITRGMKSLLPHIAYVRDVFSCFPVVISEASLVSPKALDSPDSVNKPDDEVAVDIALWNLDFLLYSMSKVGLSIIAQLNSMLTSSIECLPRFDAPVLRLDILCMDSQ